MKITASIDDGCASDVRAAELFTKFGVKTTFYWPVEWRGLAFRKGYEPLSYFQARAISRQHEVGSHGITHEHLTDMTFEDAQSEIRDSKVMLQRLFDKKINKFAPSRGYITPELVKYALSQYKEMRLTRGSYLVHVHPSSGANDNLPWYELAYKSLEETGDVHLWGHSWEFDNFQLWDQLEDFLWDNI